MGPALTAENAVKWNGFWAGLPLEFLAGEWGGAWECPLSVVYLCPEVFSVWKPKLFLPRICPQLCPGWRAQWKGEIMDPKVQSRRCLEQWFSTAALQAWSGFDEVVTSLKDDKRNKGTAVRFS